MREKKHKLEEPDRIVKQHRRGRRENRKKNKAKKRTNLGRKNAPEK